MPNGIHSKTTPQSPTTTTTSPRLSSLYISERLLCHYTNALLLDSYTRSDSCSLLDSDLILVTFTRRDWRPFSSISHDRFTATTKQPPPHPNFASSPPTSNLHNKHTMSTFPMHNSYYRPSSLTVDTHTHQNYNFGEDEEGSILDDNILDQSALDSGLEMSPPMDGSRRDSFAVASSLFSPKTDEWQHVDLQPMGSNNPFLEHQNNNPFMRVDSQSSTYGHQGQGHGWPMGNHSGMSTPMQNHDGLSSEYEVNAPLFQRPMQNHGIPFSGNQNMPVFSSSSTSNGSIPPSPQKDSWSVAEAMDHRAMPKRMRPHSPTLRSHHDMSRRGDGIRKKNARVNIPAERSLTNIDQLIAQSQDELEIKELKQQKRLLRNRQAAYDFPIFWSSFPFRFTGPLTSP